MAIVTSGAAISEVGRLYDVAIGYSTDGTTAAMTGYLVAEGSQWQEGTDLTDEEHLVQIGTPNSSDRFGRYPVISQGDWTGGERQLYYVIPNQYYTTDGNLDTTKPGALQLLPVQPQSGGTFSTLSTTSGVYPVETDGVNFYISCRSSASLNMVSGTIVNSSSSSVGSNQVGGGFEIGAMCSTPMGVFVSIPADGIYQIDNIGFLGHGTKVTSDSTGVSPYKNLAYMSGRLWYLHGSGALTLSYIQQPFPGNAPGTTAITIPGADNLATCLTTNASGLVICVGGPGVNLGVNTVVYTSDGVSLNRIGEIPGMVMYGCEANGSAYLLAQLAQVPLYPPSSTVGWLPQYTLYRLDGSTLTPMDDLRYALSDFQASNPQPNTQNQCGGSMYSDGHYLYVAWPGLPLLIYDLTNEATFRNTQQGGSGLNNLVSHHVTKAGGYVVQHYVTRPQGGAGTLTLNWYVPVANSAQTGSLTTSYFDAGVPLVQKRWRAVDFQLAAPLAGAATVTVAFRGDTQSAFSAPITPVATGSARYTAYLPIGTVFHRIQLKITLASDAFNNAPVVSYYSLRYDLGRVWDITVACHTRQVLRDGSQDTKLGIDKMAVIKNIRNLSSGDCVLFIPSPVAGPTYVEQVNAQLIDYTVVQTRPAVRDNDSNFDMEGDVRLQLVEQL